MSHFICLLHKVMHADEMDPDNSIVSLQLIDAPYVGSHGKGGEA